MRIDQLNLDAQLREDILGNNAPRPLALMDDKKSDRSE
jgi:hypothetical protein